MKKFRVWLANGDVADIVADSFTLFTSITYNSRITFKNEKGDVIADFYSIQGWAESKSVIEEVYLQ